MDPDNPQPVRADPMSLTTVQRWVMSTLAVITVFHFAGGIALAAVMAPESRLDARIVLNILAAVAGIAGMVAGRAIHQKRMLSPWLLAGCLPGLVGAYFTFLWR
jgi:hypothetical protein